LFIVSLNAEVLNLTWLMLSCITSQHNRH